MRVCPNPDCPFQGQPQHASQFYKKKRQCRTCCKRVAAAWRMAARERFETSPFEVDREPKMRLPIEPFRRWLAVVEMTIDADDRMAVLAARLEISERRLWSWLRDQRQQTVDLDLIDRALCAWGDPRLLGDLYPALYVTCGECGLTGLHSERCSQHVARKWGRVAA
jgi:hypothetical protein